MLPRQVVDDRSNGDELVDKDGADRAEVPSDGENVEMETRMGDLRKQVRAALDQSHGNSAANISEDLSVIQIPGRAPQENSLQVSSVMLNQTGMSLDVSGMSQNVVTVPENQLVPGKNVNAVSMQDRVQMRRANASAASMGTPRKIEPEIIELIQPEDSDDLYD